MRPVVRVRGIVSHHEGNTPGLRPLVGLVVLVALLAACGDDAPTAPSNDLRPRGGPEPTLIGGASTYIIDPVDPNVGPQTYGDARGLNSVGQATGAASFPTGGGNWAVYRWSSGSGLAPLITCCNTAFGSDINDAGDIVGTRDMGAASGLRGFVITGTSVTTLPIPAGADPDATARANAINNAGQIAGVSPVPGPAFHAVLWTTTGSIQDLGTLGGSISEAFDINNGGTVIGSSLTAGDAATRFFIWSAANGMQDLNTIIGATVTRVVEINDAGQIIGTYTTGGQLHAFLYTPGAGLRDLGTLGGSVSVPTGLNSRGEVVGNSTIANGAMHAFLWTPSDGMEDITNVTGVVDVRRLNDNLQTLSGTAALHDSPLLTVPLPRLVQLTATQGGNHPPIARFTVNCAGQSSPTQCAFDASGSTDDQGIVSYKWDWGNGRSETKTASTVRNTWSASGIYTVTLTVMDAGGLVGMYSRQVAVGSVANQRPTTMIANPPDRLTFTQGAAVTFVGSGNDLEDGALSGSSLAWTSDIDGVFGTGTSVTTSSLSVGTHFIRLIATDSQGATGGGNGVFITIAAPSSPPPNQPPTAAFTYTCSGQSLPHQCAFDARPSTDDVGIVSYRWSWGNGRSETKTAPTTRNTWASAGTYTVTLTTTDGGGLSTSTSQQVVVP